MPDLGGTLGADMNKHSIVIATLVALVSSSAFAADMPLKAPAAPPPPAWTWTGFYVGGNIGYGGGNEHGNWSVFAPDIAGGTICSPAGSAFCPAASEANRFKGALGGVQAGYNWQFGDYLGGIEADFQYSGQSGSGPISTTFGLPGAVPGIVSGNSSERLEWFGTLRGRLGVMVDRWLVYGTGGLAYGQIKIQGAANATGVPLGGADLINCLTPSGCPFTPLASWSDSQTKIGWAAGAGVERYIDAHWSVKVEYLFVDLGSVGATFATLPNCYGNGNGGGATCTNNVAGTGIFRTTVNDSMVRLGANYHF